ncbi:SAM-dependent O-methyltransferase class II-type profile [Acididesulfobacillus acetoxydans]|uniref:Methylase involved in ubiquinone/menaquinone biosynthesis n=1 Tax=Acididesulfobacillus acetoxydans TaxID=1561005 RepID=A0A8S0XZV2_9FIRM|nr:methyltransferase [Acididesulfobacillus acetoxydans]CAA7602577.1 SAM-dependent O-methyltransferase class II-type profile [Acididesulfobacillus acetoxydans]CEJ07277.1 Methylase involved in ubiquinone/menaquinone biosynthesis [Acididesulfobacillus acetoxydans]
MPNDKIMTIPQELLILGAAVKTGIVEALRTNTTYTALAEKLNLNPRAVWVVVEALAALGYVVKEGETVSLSAQARDMLYNQESPDFLGFSFMHRYNLIRSWVHLPEVLVNGQPVPRDQDPENTRYFMEGMGRGARNAAPAIADFLLGKTAGGARVLDIGGGPLIYGAAFAAKGAQVTVLDLPPVVELMGERAEKAGITMISGDFNRGLPAGPFDLAFLGNICHIFGEAENAELFRKVGQALRSGGEIAVIDTVRGTKSSAAVFGVNMLVNTVNGGTWTFEQYNAWLGTAGFTHVTLDEVADRQVIRAVKP